MAGYIGSKAVNLSTTGADIAGDADVSGALDVGGAFTSQGIDDNATATAMTLDSSGRLLLGNTDGSYASANADNIVMGDRTSSAESGITFGSTVASSLRFADAGAIQQGIIQYVHDDTVNTDYMNFYTAATERMRIDGSGTIDVGVSGTGVINASNNGYIVFQAQGNNSAIAYSGGFYPGADNSKTLGIATARWSTVYAATASINTSDRNEKQDIEELSDAEQRVAVAAKGLMRKFRWRDAVEAKGDAARKHFGIIAQDLQAAFAAEGLDASRYAMFCSDTWWETQTEVPAVEAVAEVLDDDGNVVTEAVEAADAYTRTDTYETQEEAPEGATERTRLGVRYSELLAFIIGAL